MAEEKETKKTTSKKSEEVKVEKRFCTKCGKELKGEEKCSCEATYNFQMNEEQPKGIPISTEHCRMKIPYSKMV